MSEMVERVLAAIRDAVVFSETSGGISIANPEEVARATIEALREPTEWMLHEGASEDGLQTARAVWSLMIDAALKP